MKRSLLEIVQTVLSSMDSDNVNSIFDTIESEQVAFCVRDIYTAMVSNRDWPHLKRTIKLDAFSDPSLPTHMIVQEPIKKLVLLNYNKAGINEARKIYQPVKWADPDQFLRFTNLQNSAQENVDVIIDPSGVELLIRNDQAPTYFTSFDDEALVFDSYDKEVDDTLQTSKVQAHAYVMPVFKMEDTHIPDLPEHAFSALIEETKSRAAVEYRQQENPKAEQEARRQQRWLSRNDWRVEGGIRYPSYGRKSSKRHRDPTFGRNK